MASEIHLHGLNCQLDVRTDVPNYKFDIVVINEANERIPIKLRFKTLQSNFIIQNGEYHFNGHRAVDQGSYDFIRDITRIEALNPSEGYCLLLTFDHDYWTEGSSTDNYYQFSLHQDRVIHEGRELRWQNHPAPGSIKGRESSLTPIGTYTCCWNDYSVLSENYTMRYLLVKIT